MKVIFLGPPEQQKVRRRNSHAKDSVSRIFRRAISCVLSKQKTELGKQAQSYIDKGQLVPDEMIISIVEQRLRQDDCENGYLLDGFPRTLPQAEAIDRRIDLDCASTWTPPSRTLGERLCGRRVCRECGATYHISRIISEGDPCAKCGGVSYIPAQRRQTRKRWRTPQSIRSKAAAAYRLL